MKARLRLERVGERVCPLDQIHQVAIGDPVHVEQCDVLDDTLRLAYERVLARPWGVFGRVVRDVDASWIRGKAHPRIVCGRRQCRTRSVLSIRQPAGASMKARTSARMRTRPWSESYIRCRRSS